jgi:hypothetical protein
MERLFEHMGGNQFKLIGETRFRHSDFDDNPTPEERAKRKLYISKPATPQQVEVTLNLNRALVLLKLHEREKRRELLLQIYKVDKSKGEKEAERIIRLYSSYLPPNFFKKESYVRGKSIKEEFDRCASRQEAIKAFEEEGKKHINHRAECLWHIGRLKGRGYD